MLPFIAPRNVTIRLLKTSPANAALNEMYNLQKSDATVGQIAVRTGFENPYYFSQIFKRKTASTPSGWRRARSPVIPI